MTSQYSDIEATIKSYVEGTMTDIAASQFEEYFLSQPEISKKIEAQVEFSERRNALSLEAERIFYSPKQLSFIEQIKNKIRYLVPIATVATISVFAAPLLIEYSSTNPQPDNIEVLAFSTQSSRADGWTANKAGINVFVPGGDAQNAIFIKVKPDVREFYQAELSNPETGEVLWNSEEFQVASGTRDHLFTIPYEFSGSSVELKVLSKNSAGTLTPIEFCHYSEPCL